MSEEMKTAVYDRELQVEACRFQGIEQPFPNHFHTYYVIGLVEKGERFLSCKNQAYTIRKGDMVLFHPGDNHSCTQENKKAFYYKSLHLSKEVMANFAEEVTGEKELPGFSQNVIADEEIAYCFRSLHHLIMQGSHEFQKEEHLFLLLSLLIQKFGRPFESCVPPCRAGIEKACTFMEENYASHICLDEICQYAGLSRSTLLRAFTRSKGVTPYGYLENIRISQAKKLLEQGVPPAETALQTGFSDQSHFTNYFSRFIGLPPGAYRGIFLDKAVKTEEKLHGAL